MEVAKHFSTTWRSEIANGTKTLRIDSQRDCAKFLVQWMWSGGSVFVGKDAVLYPANDLSNLQALNTLTTRLGTQALVDRTAADIDRVNRTIKTHKLQQDKWKASKEAYMAKTAARADNEANGVQRVTERAPKDKASASREAEYVTNVECYSCHKTG